MDTVSIPLTADELELLVRLVAQEIIDTVNNRKARILKRILVKLDHAA